MGAPPAETWETGSAASVAIIKFDQRGGERQEVHGGRPGVRFRLTTEERAYNQELVANPGQDPFTNGTLVLITGVPDPDSPAQIVNDPRVESPNALSRADLVAIFAKTGMAFQSAVNKIDSEITLRRLRDLAVELDAKQSQTEYLDRVLEPFKVTGKQSTVYSELVAN